MTKFVRYSDSTREAASWPSFRIISFTLSTLLWTTIFKILQNFSDSFFRFEIRCLDKTNGYPKLSWLIFITCSTFMVFSRANSCATSDSMT